MKNWFIKIGYRCTLGNYTAIKNKNMKFYIYQHKKENVKSAYKIIKIIPFLQK